MNQLYIVGQACDLNAHEAKARDQWVQGHPKGHKTLSQKERNK